MIASFFFVLFAIVGICILFHVPVRRIPAGAVIGAITWILYQLTLSASGSIIFSCFIGACGVGLMSEIAARVFKDAATIFIIPGILCLVPGLGIYKTMAAMVSDNLNTALNIGAQTVFTAGAVAFGLLAMTSIIRIVLLITKKIDSRQT